MSRKRVALNVVGPFYVEDGCCTQCGVPQTFETDMFPPEGECYVRKQPATEDELDAMVQIIGIQEFTCIRYGGADPEILVRLAENGDAASCDRPVPAGATAILVNHASFALHERAWTAHALLDQFLSTVPSWSRTPIVQIDARLASVSIAWYQESYHRIEAFSTHPPDRWVVRHAGPRGLSRTIHAWLHEIGATELRWQTEAQWKTDGPFRAKPF